MSLAKETYQQPVQSTFWVLPETPESGLRSATRTWADQSIGGSNNKKMKLSNDKLEPVRPFTERGSSIMVSVPGEQKATCAAPLPTQAFHT